MRRLATLSLSLALLVPGEAEAHIPYQKEAMAVAYMVFPSPCLSVEVSQANLRRPYQPKDYDGMALGSPWCHIYLPYEAHAWGYRHVCQVLLHEMGHVAGRVHSKNPRSIMRSFPMARRDRRC